MPSPSALDLRAGQLPGSDADESIDSDDADGYLNAKSADSRESTSSSLDDDRLAQFVAELDNARGRRNPKEEQHEPPRSSSIRTAFDAAALLDHMPVDGGSASLRAGLRRLIKSTSGSIPAPQSHREKERLDRDASYTARRQSMAKWDDLARQARGDVGSVGRASSTRLDLSATGPSQEPGVRQWSASFAPTADFEVQIRDLASVARSKRSSTARTDSLRAPTLADSSGRALAVNAAGASPRSKSRASPSHTTGGSRSSAAETRESTSGDLHPKNETGRRKAVPKTTFPRRKTAARASRPTSQLVDGVDQEPPRPATSKAANPWLGPDLAGRGVREDKRARPDRDDSPAERAVIVDAGGNLCQSAPMRSTKSALQRDLAGQAFAEDAVVEEFQAEKRRAAREQGSDGAERSMPGWGHWAGTGAKRHKISRRTTSSAAKEVDASPSHVLLASQKADKAAKYQVCDFAFPYTTAAQQQMAMDQILAPERLSQRLHRHRVRPDVLTRPGERIAPLKP